MNQGNNCGGSGHERERNRGEKSVAFRGNVWPSSQKDYRSLLSESDREDRKPGNGSSVGGRSRRNVSYRRDAFDDDRELRTSGFIDFKGRERDMGLHRGRSRSDSERASWPTAPLMSSNPGGPLDNVRNRLLSASASLPSDSLQATRRCTMGDDDTSRNSRGRKEDDATSLAAAGTDRLLKLNMDRRKTGRREMEEVRHSTAARGKHKHFSWEEGPLEASHASRRPSLTQETGRSSVISSTRTLSAASIIHGKSCLYESSHNADKGHNQYLPRSDEQGVPEVFCQSLLCRPLDGGYGPRRAPWRYSDLSITEARQRRVAFELGEVQGAGVEAFAFGHDTFLTNGQVGGVEGPDFVEEYPLSRCHSTYSLDNSDILEGHGSMQAPCLPTPTKTGVGGVSRLLSVRQGTAHVSSREPRMERTHSESSGSASSGRLRLGWGQGLARRATAFEQKSPRDDAAILPKKYGARGNADFAADKPNNVELSSKVLNSDLCALKDPGLGVSKATSLQNDPSQQQFLPIADGIGLPSTSFTQSRKGREQQEKRLLQNKGAKKFFQTRRLRQMAVAYVRHVWRKNALKPAARVSLFTISSSSVGGVSAPGGVVSGKNENVPFVPSIDKKVVQEELLKTDAASSSNKQRKGSPCRFLEQEGGNVEVKRQKSACMTETSLTSATKHAEREAAQAKLQKYRALSAAAGYPLCGLLPKESMARALKVTACVRAFRPHADKNMQTVLKAEAEMVPLPCREDILSALEFVNADVERLQAEVTVVEDSILHGAAGSAAYRAPWWNRAYADVLRLRREASRKIKMLAWKVKKEQLLLEVSSEGARDKVYDSIQASNATDENANENRDIRCGALGALAKRQISREAIQSIVQSRVIQIHRYVEQLTDQYTQIDEAWKQSHPPRPDESRDAHFASDMRTTRTLAALQRTSFPGANASDRPTRMGAFTLRGGDFAGSEYDVSLITREIEKKEKMKIRIEQGGAEIPTMLSLSGRFGTHEFSDTSSGPLTSDGGPMRCASRTLTEKCTADCNCPRAVERRSRYVNPWSDMEKCIFLDKFLQYPKNFRKIASFLRRKSTHDVIEFYYDSKQCIHYKALLKENEARRRGADQNLVWLKHAARQVGATIDLRCDNDGHEVLRLYPPGNDYLYTTFNKHPGSRPFHQTSLLQQSGEYVKHQAVARRQVCATSQSIEQTTSYAPLPSFAFPERHSAQLYGGNGNNGVVVDRSSVPNDAALNMLPTLHHVEESRSSVVFQERDETHFVTPADFSPRQHDDEDVEGKRVMTKWTEEEKHYAIQLLETYGKQWALISGMMEGSKKPEQIKNFFSNYKKKYRLDERLPPSLPVQRRKEYSATRRVKSPQPRDLATTSSRGTALLQDANLAHGQPAHEYKETCTPFLLDTLAQDPNSRAVIFSSTMASSANEDDKKKVEAEQRLEGSGYVASKAPDVQSQPQGARGSKPSGDGEKELQSPERLHYGNLLI